ncbi:hypothetical protein HELRODRAFT_146843, partial [Helobdella robusta]|uniref:Fibrinogen C-terminal domain-containing protein n=1 Tax=Helobdella robusta TaxID=6412 RepID=T1EJU9_HELRO
WIIIQQRMDTSVSFNKNFPTYEAGFGDQVNFWIGLTTIYEITKNQNYKIRFEMQNSINNWYSAEYSFFYLDPPSSQYILRLGSYVGDAGDAIN